MKNEIKDEESKKLFTAKNLSNRFSAGVFASGFNCRHSSVLQIQEKQKNFFLIIEKWKHTKLEGKADVWTLALVYVGACHADSKWRLNFWRRNNNLKKNRKKRF